MIGVVNKITSSGNGGVPKGVQKGRTPPFPLYWTPLTMLTGKLTLGRRELEDFPVFLLCLHRSLTRCEAVAYHLRIGYTDTMRSIPKY